jgi:20S proteasome alpha/beta subunit
VGFIVLGTGLFEARLIIRKANAIGRSSKTVREFLERNYKDGMTRDETIKLTIKSLLEVVQTGAKNIEIAILEEGKPLEVITFLRRTNESFLILSRLRLL